MCMTGVLEIDRSSEIDLTALCNFVSIAPSDVLGEIFANCLTSFESLPNYVALSLTCKRFRNVLVAKGAELFRPLIENHDVLTSEMGVPIDSHTYGCSYKKVELYIRLVQRYATTLKIARFAGYSSIRGADVCCILKSMPDLTELSWSCDYLGGKAMDEQLAAVGRCAKLQHFSDDRDDGLNVLDQVLEAYWRAIASIPTVTSMTVTTQKLFNPELYNFQRTPWPYLRHLGLDFSNSGAICYRQIELLDESFNPDDKTSLFSLDPLLHRMVSRVSELPQLKSVHFLNVGIQVESDDSNLSQCLGRLMAKLEALKSLEKVVWKLRLEVLYPSRPLCYPLAISVKVGKTHESSVRFGDCTYEGLINGYLPDGMGKLLDARGEVVFTGEFKSGVIQSGQGYLIINGEKYNSHIDHENGEIHFTLDDPVREADYEAEAEGKNLSFQSSPGYIIIHGKKYTYSSPEEEELLNQKIDQIMRRKKLAIQRAQNEALCYLG